MTGRGNKNGQQDLGRGNGITGNENTNRGAATGTGTVTTTDKNRTAANKRSRNAAIRNEASTAGATVREEEENKDRILETSCCVPILDSEAPISIYRNRTQPKIQNQDPITSKEPKQNESR